MAFKPSDYSLADFLVGDSQNPLVPSADFVAWRAATNWATSLYLPKLHGAATARAMVESAGSTRSSINMASYNYLGLSTHPETVAAAQEALLRYGTGVCGSPMLSGMTDLHEQFEQEFSRFVGTDSTVLFNTGYVGAVATLTALLRRGDVAIADSKAHISAVEGIKLSGAKLVMFEHNNVQSLSDCLDQHKDKRRLVLLEGLYSMEGDLPCLPELLAVTEAHDVPVFIDEAHSILTCGAHGRGTAEHFDVESRIGLRYATMSKGFASIGGVVSGARDTLDYVRVYANGYGFSVALPASVVAGLLAALRVSQREPALRERLWANGTYFRKQLQGLGVDTGPSTTFVVPIMMGSNRERLYSVCHDMRARGLFLPPIDYPVVPQDQVRYRASISALHTRADLDEALNIIEDTVVRTMEP